VSTSREKISDLVRAGLLQEGTVLHATRNGVAAKVVVTDDGGLAPVDGSGPTFKSPSAASVALFDVRSDNGWATWQTPDGYPLTRLRDRYRAIQDA
jgi:hypothetical protein